MASAFLRTVVAALLASGLAAADPGGGQEAPPASTGANGTWTAAALLGVDSFGPGAGFRVAAGASGSKVRMDFGVTVRFARGELRAVGVPAGPGATAPGSVARGTLEVALSAVEGRVRPWGSVGLTRVGAEVDGDSYTGCIGPFCGTLETEGPTGSANGLELAGGVHVLASRWLLVGGELRWTSVRTVALEGTTPVEVGGPWLGFSITARR